MRHAEVRRRDRVAEIEKFAAENEIPVQNAQLLNTALTHTSYANEHKMKSFMTMNDWNS